MTAARMRRDRLVAGLTAIAAAVGFLIWTTSGGGDEDPLTSSPTTAATAPMGTTDGEGDDGGPTSAPLTGAPGAARATGRGTCGFLSTDDIAKAAGATKVELRQSQGPSGNPGCEWVLGEERAPLQLEFVDATPGPAPTLPQGEDVEGPWEDARWVAGTRSLYVKGVNLSLIVRASDPDRARAKTVATNLALLAIERS